MSSENEGASKRFKVIAIVVAVVVAGVLAFGIPVVLKSFKGETAPDVAVSQSAEPSETPYTAPPEESSSPSSSQEATEEANAPEGSPLEPVPYDGGVEDGSGGVIFNFGEQVEMPFPGSQAIERTIGETNLAGFFLGSFAKGISGINDCKYLSKGYYVCPVGEGYVQIIEAKYQTTFAFAKQGTGMDSAVSDLIKSKFKEPSEGLGGGALKGYYIVSRGAVQDIVGG